MGIPMISSRNLATKHVYGLSHHPFFTPNCGCVTVSLRHIMAFLHGTCGFDYSQNLVGGNSYREP